MKEITVISGKGGTGKTSVTAAFAWLGGKNVLVADCDVDASDMHLLLVPEIVESEQFFSGKSAVVNNETCIQCNRCMEVCRFEAIENKNGKYSVIGSNCEGCGFCFQVCPAGAIQMTDKPIGKLYVSETRLNNILVHAKLNIGADNSGKLVSKIREVAKSKAKSGKIKYVLSDGSPGTGCPVIASVTGTDYVVIITEPTISGFHDLKRVIELISHFGTPAGCIINKSDLNPETTSAIKVYLKANQVALLAEIPYSQSFTDAITEGCTIVEKNKGAIFRKIKESWEKIQKSGT